MMMMTMMMTMTMITMVRRLRGGVAAKKVSLGESGVVWHMGQPAAARMQTYVLKHIRIKVRHLAQPIHRQTVVTRLRIWSSVQST